MALSPIYYLLGQNALKGSINEDWLTKNLDENLDDAEATIDIYDHLVGAADTYDSTPASMLSNTQSTADKLLIACDCTLFRKILANLHTGGFACVKRTDMGNLGNSGSDRWGKSFGESWDNIAAADTAVRAVIDAAGDTPDPKGAFLCFGYQEGVTGNTTLDAAFQTDLNQLIADLRADYMNSTAVVIFDFPPASVSGYTAAQNASLVSARQSIMKVCHADPYASFVNTDHLERTSGGVEYTGAATMELGELLAAEMERMLTGKGSVTGGGIPTYIILGDEGAVGAVEQSFLGDESGDDYGGGIDNSYIWNHSSGQWEQLDGQDNSNSGADGLTKFGPDVAMVTALISDIHPGENVAIFKLGFNSSSLGLVGASGGSWAKADLDNYDAAEVAWALAKAAMITDLDVIPDVRAIIFYQAEEDAATQTLANAYEANLAILIDNLRSDFSSRVGENTPILIPKMIDTGTYTAEMVQAIRDAQVAVAAQDPRVSLIDADALQVHTNLQNLAGSGIHAIGKAMAAEMAIY